MKRGMMGLCGIAAVLAAISFTVRTFDSASAQTTATGPVSDRADGPRVSPDIRRDLSICCRRAGRTWMTTLLACRRDGGRMLPENQCTRDTCCRIGAQSPFLTTRQDCTKRRGRSIVHDRCHGRRETVCCRHKGRDEWAYRNKCLAIGGRIIRSDRCNPLTLHNHERRAHGGTVRKKQ